LYVASEIKGIIGLDPEARRMDHGRIRDLVRDSRIDDWTGTCFSRIRPVAPGTVMKYADGHVTARRYWVLRPSPDPTLSPGDVLATLVEAVKRHTPSGVDLGLALSGGIDSSSLAGILAHSALPETGSVQAFSITPPNTIDESALIDATIRHTGIRHTYVGLDSLDYSQSLGRLIVSHDEPVQYCGVFYQFVLRDYMAKAGCRAVMVGYGADEIFGGYTYLAPAFLIALALRGRFGVLRAELLDLLSSEDFYGSGLWSRRCGDLYRTDLARRERAGLWFRVYVLKAHGSSPSRPNATRSSRVKALPLLNMGWARSWEPRYGTPTQSLPSGCRLQ
jgi:asparagine synthase (glutamine-hydrolysing)